MEVSVDLLAGGQQSQQHLTHIFQAPQPCPPHSPSYGVAVVVSPYIFLISQPEALNPWHVLNMALLHTPTFPITQSEVLSVWHAFTVAMRGDFDPGRCVRVCLGLVPCCCRRKLIAAVSDLRDGWHGKKKEDDSRRL